MISYDLRFEGEPMSRPFRRRNHAVHDQHWVNPQIIEQSHLLDPNAVWNRGQYVNIQLWKEVRGNTHTPGIGECRSLTQISEATTHRIRLQNWQQWILKEWTQIEPGKMRLATDYTQVQGSGNAQITGEVIGDNRF